MIFGQLRRNSATSPHIPNIGAIDLIIIIIFISDIVFFYLGGLGACVNMITVCDLKYMMLQNETAFTPLVVVDLYVLVSV